MGQAGWWRQRGRLTAWGEGALKGAAMNPLHGQGRREAGLAGIDPNPLDSSGTAFPAHQGAWTFHRGPHMSTRLALRT